MSEILQFEFPKATGVFPPVDHSPDGLREWILETCRYLSLTPTELAKAADLAASTINRFLREKESGNLSARTIEALLQTAGKIEADNEFRLKLDIPPNQSGRPYLVDVAVFGRAQAGHYADFSTWMERLYRMRLPVRAPYHTRGIGAYEVADAHAEPVFKKGSLVVVSPIYGTSDYSPVAGDYVMMFRPGHHVEPQQKGIELTIRHFVESPSGELWLTPIAPSPDIPDIRYQQLAGPYVPHSLIIASFQFHK